MRDKKNIDVGSGMEIIEKDFNEVSTVVNELLNVHTASLGMPEFFMKKVALELIVDGKVCGGITGTLTNNNFHIGILAISPKYRGLNYGAKLLSSIEKLAIEKGAEIFTVTTYSYQACGFYEKQDYVAFGELKDVPITGASRYYLSKKA